MEACLEYLEWMNAVLDGEATEEERARLEAHLAGCPACAALYADLAALRAGAEALVVPAPEGLADSVMEQVRAPRQSRPVRRWRGVAALAAVCAVALLGAGSLKYLSSYNYATGGTSNAAGGQVPQATAPAPDPTEESAEAARAGESGSADLNAVRSAPAVYGATQSAEAAASDSDGPSETASPAAQKEPFLSISAASVPPEPVPEPKPKAAPETEPGSPAADNNLALNGLTADTGEGQSVAPAATPAPITPDAALERVVDYLDERAEGALSVAYTDSEDDLFCDLTAQDQGTVLGRVVYDGISPNGIYYTFTHIWDGQSEAEAALNRFAVRLDGYEGVLALDQTDGAHFRAALGEE